MNAKLHIVVSILLGTFTVGLPADYKAQYLFSIDENGNKSQNFKVEKTDQVIFYIVVPGFTDQLSQKYLKQLNMFAKNALVPENFFEQGSPSKPITPIKLFLDWNEKGSNKIRKQASENLSKGISELHRQFKKAKFILIGHEQGGNVINLASNQTKVKFDTVIQFSTPIFPHSSKKSYSDYLPNTDMIGKLFSFYTEQSFIHTEPSSNSLYEKKYNQKMYPDFINIKLMINNQHPQSFKMIQPFVGKRILSLCQKIKETYPLFNDFIAHLSSMRSSTDMLIFIQNNAKPIKTGAEYRKEIMGEKTLSNNTLKNFNVNWGRPLQPSLDKDAQSRSSNKSITIKASKK